MNLVKGINNYCDRWCERCTETTRCKYFAAGEAVHQEDLDKRNEGFWTGLLSGFRDALEVVEAAAREQGFDLDGEALGKSMQTTGDVMERAREHPMMVAAWKYLVMTEEWFEGYGVLFREFYRELVHQVEGMLRFLRTFSRASGAGTVLPSSI